MNDLVSEKSSAKFRLNWLLWWRIDSDKLEQQILEYDSLPFYKTMRGKALLYLLLSCVTTVLLVQFQFVAESAYLDVVLMLVLGAFTFYGHRWAMILAMVLWTFEKGTQLVGLATAGRGTGLFISVIWWAAYMHAFYFALRIENERAKIDDMPAAPPPPRVVKPTRAGPRGRVPFGRRQGSF